MRRRRPRTALAASGAAMAAGATTLLLFALLSSAAGSSSSSASLELPTEFGAAAPALMRMSDTPDEPKKTAASAPAAPQAALPTGGWAPAAQAVGGGTAAAFAPAEPANAPAAAAAAAAAKPAPAVPAPSPPRIPSVAGYTPLWMKDQGAAALAKQQLEQQQRGSGGGGGGGAKKAGGASLLKTLAKRAVDPTGAASDDDGGADYAMISSSSDEQQRKGGGGLLSSLLGGGGGGGGSGEASTAGAAAAKPSSLPEFEEEVYLPADEAEALIARGQAVDAGSNLRVAGAAAREAAPAAPAAAAASGGGGSVAGAAKLLGSLGTIASLLNSGDKGGGAGGGGNGGVAAGQALAGLAGALGGALRAGGGSGGDESRGLGGGESGGAAKAAATLKAAAGQGAAGAAVVAKGLASVLGLPTDLPDKAPDLPSAKQAISGLLSSIDLSKVDLNDVSGSLERLSGDALRGLDSTLAGAGQSATQYVSQLSANMKPPKVAVSNIEVTRVAVYGWNVSQALSGVVDGVGGGGVAGAVVGGGAAGTAAAATGAEQPSFSSASSSSSSPADPELRANATTASTTFDAAAVVGRTVTVGRYEKKASWRVSGSVTVSNVNIVPLVVTGLAVTVSSGDSPVPATLAAAAAAAAAGGYPPRRTSGGGARPAVARVVADCPAASETSDTIVVPGTPLSSLMPGKLECTFEATLPGDLAAETVGKITAALTVALLPSLSGQVAPAVPFSLSNAKREETGACATVTDTYFSDSNQAALALSRVGGAGATMTGLAEAAGQLAAPQLAPSEIAAGDKPPSEDEARSGGSADSRAVRVCGPEGRTFLYAARYGPYNNGACGSFASTNVVRVVPDGAAAAEVAAGANGGALFGGGADAASAGQQPPGGFAAGLAGLLGLASGNSAGAFDGASGFMGMGGAKEGAAGGEWFGGGGDGGGGGTATATMLPTGGVSAATLPVAVTGCLPVVVASVQPRMIRRYSWDAQQQAAAVALLNGGGAAAGSGSDDGPLFGALGGDDGAAFWAAPGSSLPLAYTVRFTRSADVRRVLTGSVVLHNPTARPLTVKSAVVMAGAAQGGAAGAEGGDEATDANLLPGCVRADGSTFAPDAVVVPPASGSDGKPGTLTCRFRLELPVSAAGGGGEAEGGGGEGEVRAEVSYADDPLGRAREGSAVSYAFGGPGSAVLEVGKCADVRVGFEEEEDGGASKALMLRPRSLGGALPPGLAASVGVARAGAAGGTGAGGARVCSPTSFSFRATFGPFLGGCGSARATRTVATATPVAASGAGGGGGGGGGSGSTPSSPALASALAARVVRRALPVGVAVAGGVCGPVVPSAAASAAAGAAGALGGAGAGGGGGGGFDDDAGAAVAAAAVRSRAGLRLPASMADEEDVASLSGPPGEDEAPPAAAAPTTPTTTPAAAPVAVRIASLEPGVVAAAYSWTVRAGTSPPGPSLSVEPGGSAALTRVVVVRRSNEAQVVAPSGSAGYALSGKVEVRNPTLCPLPPLRRVAVSVARPAKGGGGGGGGARPSWLEVPTTCAPGTIVQPGQTLDCSFAVAYPDTVASRAVATAEFLVGSDDEEEAAAASRPSGATPPVPRSVKSEPARFFFDRPRAVIAGECASVTDDLSLSAPVGVAGSSSGDGLLSVLDDGQGLGAVKAPASADVASGAAAPLRLCGSGDRSFRYQVLLGPLGGAGRCFGLEGEEEEGASASYTLRARAAAAPLVAGAAAAVPSSALRSSVVEAGRGPTALVSSETELAVELSGC